MTSLLDEFKIALHGVWQRRWLAMAVAWGIALLGWLVVALIPNSYESKARIQVEVNDVVSEGSGNPMNEQRRFEQLKDSLASVRNLSEVVVTTGIVDRAADDGARAAAAAALQKNMLIVASPNNAIELKASLGGGGRSDAQNAALVTRVVEATIAQFRDSGMRDGAASAQQSIAFLDREILNTQNRLTAAESARAGFEARNLGMLPGVGSPSARADAARSEMAQIDTQLISVNSQLAATPPSLSTPGLGATGASVARQQLGSAQGELASMRARGLTAAHPDVIALSAQIAALQAQVAREPSGAGGGSSQNPAYAGLAAQRAALSARRGQLSAEIAQINARRIQEPAVAAEYDRLNRDYTVVKDQYDRLVARREQVRLRGAAESNADAVRITVLDAPSIAKTPASPNKPLLLITVLFAALGGGAATAFALSQLQTTYPTAARLARASGLPVLGSVTEILTDQLRADRAFRLRRFIMVGGGLAALCLLLLGVEFFQRSTVG
jgi:polysaccharide chain length determinant protein (PEP-CTERM system associated)